MDLTTLKEKELYREYKAFIQEPKKIDYYTGKFSKLKQKNSKISFNLCGFLFSTYWCFYRKMLGWGCMALVLNLGSMYLGFAYGLTAIGTVVSAVLSLFFGFFGNYLYLRYVEQSIAKGLELDAEKKQKYYKENGGDGIKILLCMLFVTLVMAFALAASFGLEGMTAQTV